MSRYCLYLLTTGAISLNRDIGDSQIYANKLGARRVGPDYEAEQLQLARVSFRPSTLCI
jgi:hypothetical protein